jgi:tetratricopeptide (TPR) repeat protein
MAGIPSLHWPHRLCSSLLQALLITNLGYPVSVAAHVGAHEKIETLSHRIQQDPANSQLYLSRGEVYRLHGNQHNAIMDFSKALTIDPESVTAITGLARTYLDQGDHQQAIVNLNRALALEPCNVRALSVRAQANMETGRPLFAAADYTHAIEQTRQQGKPLPDYFLKRARAYEAAGDQYIESALLSLDEGIELLGNIRSLSLYAVELETRLENFTAAHARLSSILGRATRKEFLLLQRGDILSLAGDTTAATKDYLAAQAAIESLPTQRRHSVSVIQLQHDIEARLASRENHRRSKQDDDQDF